MRVPHPTSPIPKPPPRDLRPPNPLTALRMQRRFLELLLRLQVVVVEIPSVFEAVGVGVAGVPAFDGEGAEVVFELEVGGEGMGVVVEFEDGGVGGWHGGDGVEEVEGVEGLDGGGGLLDGVLLLDVVVVGG